MSDLAPVVFVRSEEVFVRYTAEGHRSFLFIGKSASFFRPYWLKQLQQTLSCTPVYLYSFGFSAYLLSFWMCHGALVPTSPQA